MRFRWPMSGLVFVVMCAGCAGGLPTTTATTSAFESAALSAHRPLASVSTQTIDRRDTAALSAFPAPLSAFPAPLSAFPAPLSAFPAIGQVNGTTSSALCTLAGNTPGPAGCHAKVRTDVPIQPSSTPAELLSGMLPGWIQQIYNLPPLNLNDGAHVTVAVVVAFDDPAAEADLAVYRNTFGLPPCTTANGCFKKIAQDGSTNYPALNVGWAVEAATDIETVSAVCPACNIMLVEASSSNIPDLAAAVDRAAAAGAKVISNSYGVPEASDNVQYDSHYNHPGVAVVASAGDRGYGAMFPASSEYVIAVGGTTLYESAGGLSEVVWPLTNSGCSAFIKKPNWQHDPGCKMRVMNDLAVVADPSTGMAVYDSILNGSSGGWTVIGGTSIGSPIVSAIIAMGPHPEHYAGAQQLYNHANTFFSITSGSNGTCAIAYFCQSQPGYDGPTGIGAPNGNQAFNS